MDLSVVIPAYRAGTFLAGRLRALTEALDAEGLDYETIVVDDGSPDDTAAVAEALGHPRVRVLRGGARRGKFGALKLGVAESKGSVVVFTDADVPYETCALKYFVDAIRNGGFHVVVGDRTLPGSSYAERMGLVRGLATRIFSFAVRVFFTGGVNDTQCGLKAFRGDVARALFALLREEGFAGDVELLYVALKYNLALRRVPVRLRHQGASTVSAWRHGPNMVAAIFRTKARYVRGAYASEALTAIARQDYWNAEGAARDA
jgi:dolichyl-phosphate beta-glucosyltransferase